MQTANPFEALFGIGQSEAEQAAALADTAAYWAAHAADEAARIAAHSAPVQRAMRPHRNRCGGRGYLPSFQHIKGGACFACN